MMPIRTPASAPRQQRQVRNVANRLVTAPILALTTAISVSSWLKGWTNGLVANTMDTIRGGHSYAEHGAHVTDYQHDTRLRTGEKPSGVIPVKPNGSPIIPKTSSSFASDAEHLDVLRNADQELINMMAGVAPGGTLSRRIVFDIDMIQPIGTMHQLDNSSTPALVKQTAARKARVIYDLNQATNKYELVTLFPIQ